MADKKPMLTYKPDSEVKELYMKAKNDGNFFPFVNATLRNALFLSQHADANGDGKPTLPEVQHMVANTEGLDQKRFCNALNDPEKRKLREEFAVSLKAAVTGPLQDDKVGVVADNLAAIVNSEAGILSFIAGTSGGALKPAVKQVLENKSLPWENVVTSDQYDFGPEEICNGQSRVPRRGKPNQRG